MIAKLLVLITLFIMAAYGTSIAYTVFSEEQATWHQENKCIAGYIKLGIERANIVRDAGSCKVK